MTNNNEKNDTFTILDLFLKKHHKRAVRLREIKNGRRVSISIKEIYRDYEKPNADIDRKMSINESARDLEDRGYITVKRMEYSDDIEKFFLNETKINEIEAYMDEQYGMTARQYLLQEVRELADEYDGRGEITDYYCTKLKYDSEHSTADFDAARERELLNVLAFIQDNETDLYVREVSVLVYGDSKYFENDRRYEEVCTLIREAIGQEKKEYEPNDEILQHYHISNVEQEISIKGDFLIQLGGCELETKYFSGGISLSSRDIGKIDWIRVRTNNVMTIENKTSYYRFDRADYSEIYLGGYANRHQIEFIKKVYSDNRDCNYLHFGDIDVGGFLIHQHLSGATGVNFQLFHMGKEELHSRSCRQARIPLTDNDVLRAEKLRENPVYSDVITEMLQMRMKLEQEIISYSLCGMRVN